MDDLRQPGEVAPARLKAQGLALFALGYPCREVAKRLKERYPDAKVPHYSTISRWQRPMPRTDADRERWLRIRSMAADIVEERLRQELKKVASPARQYFLERRLNALAAENQPLYARDRRQRGGGK